MKFTMTRPCAHCPFRSDVPGYLRPERAEEIAESIFERGESFPCHETTVPADDEECRLIATADSQHCAGALILMERMRRPNQMARIAERLGMYDYRRLDMDAPVFDTAREFIDHRGRATETAKAPLLPWQAHPSGKSR